MPSSIARPCSGETQNVSGVNRATPMVAVKPGRAPKTAPRHTPMARNPSTCHARTADRPAKISAISPESSSGPRISDVPAPWRSLQGDVQAYVKSQIHEYRQRGSVAEGRDPSLA